MPGNLTQAFYILFANQINSPSSWPRKVCQNGGVGPQGSECVDASNYRNGIFVTSPQNITKEDVAKVKRDVPGSKLVLYWDFGEMPVTPAGCLFCTGHIMGDLPGRNCTTTYPCGVGSFTSALNEAVPPELLIRWRTGEHPVWEYAEGMPGLPAYCWNKKLAPILAKFLGGWVKDHGFDGIYLDGYVEPDHVHIGAEPCNVVDHGQYEGPMVHMDAPGSAANLGAKLSGSCGFDGKEPCNISALKEGCDSFDGCNGFNTNGEYLSPLLCIRASVPAIRCAHVIA